MIQIICGFLIIAFSLYFICFNFKYYKFNKQTGSSTLPAYVCIGFYVVVVVVVSVMLYFKICRFLS